jgi:hypothetical protein
LNDVYCCRVWQRQRIREIELRFHADLNSMLLSDVPDRFSIRYATAKNPPQPLSHKYLCLRCLY